MTPITAFSGRVVPLPIDNIDTDQIIPARFLKTIVREGLGASLFADWRYDASDQPRPGFILNQPRSRGATILLAGDNFGCGSSREHAPWALLDFGFKAVISTSFADIFCSNCLKNGLLPVAVDQATHAALLAAVTADAGAQAGVDLERQELRLPGGGTARFTIDLFSKRCLMAGVDQLGYILDHEANIAAFEGAHPA